MNSPDDSACWLGDWSRAEPRVDLWAHSALIRTVSALPRLHAWRLGDEKGSRRSLIWCGVIAADAESGSDAVAALSQSAPDPSIPLGDDGRGSPLVDPLSVANAATTVAGGLLSALAASMPRDVSDAIADSVAPTPQVAKPRKYRKPGAGVRQWVGGLAPLPGSWLPPLAILPRSRRDYDDPGTRWQTESLAFAVRHTVHADDTRYAADLLAPHVTALVLEHVPPDAAVTIAGDAIHVWWEYDDTSRKASGKVARTVDVVRRLRDALPSFVLNDHPDRSAEVEGRLAERAARAAAYRSKRQAGRHEDPTLARIYAQARADYEAGSGSRVTNT
jgi:hypothetical protein